VVSLDGRDFSSAFRAGRTPNTVLGLVTGLSLGRNTLTVEGKGRGVPTESARADKLSDHRSHIGNPG
jgi:hypothetical protein